MESVEQAEVVEFVLRVEFAELLGLAKLVEPVVFVWFLVSLIVSSVLKS